MFYLQPREAKQRSKIHGSTSWSPGYPGSKIGWSSLLALLMLRQFSTRPAACGVGKNGSDSRKYHEVVAIYVHIYHIMCIYIYTHNIIYIYICLSSLALLIQSFCKWIVRWIWWTNYWPVSMIFHHFPTGWWLCVASFSKTETCKTPILSGGISQYIHRFIDDISHIYHIFSPIYPILSSN